MSTPDQDFLTPHRGQSHAHSGPPGTWPGPDSRTAARRCGVQRPFGREAGLPWARRRPAPGSANPQSDQQQPSPVGVDCAPSRGTCPGGKRAIGLQALPVVALGTGRGAVARVRAAVAVVAVAGFRRRSRRLRLGFRWWSGRWHGPRWWRYRLGWWRRNRPAAPPDLAALVSAGVRGVLVRQAFGYPLRARVTDLRAPGYDPPRCTGLRVPHRRRCGHRRRGRRCVSPGGVGFDISCGVRLLTADLDAGQIAPMLAKVMDGLAAAIPRGAGPGGIWRRLRRAELAKVLLGGAAYAVQQGYGTARDLARCEDFGAAGDADPAQVSSRAVDRGLRQVGSLVRQPFPGSTGGR